jgi:ribosomal protein L5
MSTFAVFGMNEHFAREEAKRKVRDFKIKKGQRIELSVSQWLQAVEDRVIKIMNGKRVVQLSSMFDAPQYAANYAERIRKLGRCRDVIIRAKVKVPQNDVRRKSAMKLSWVDYSIESTAAA